VITSVLLLTPPCDLELESMVLGKHGCDLLLVEAEQAQQRRIDDKVQGSRNLGKAGSLWSLRFVIPMGHRISHLNYAMREDAPLTSKTSFRSFGMGLA
jgi:hypothetical protein